MHAQPHARKRISALQSLVCHTEVPGHSRCKLDSAANGGGDVPPQIIAADVASMSQAQLPGMSAEHGEDAVPEDFWKPVETSRQVWRLHPSCSRSNFAI